ncbi:hypothetical protein VPH35_124401 [Triticum aestivum]
MEQLVKDRYASMVKLLYKYRVKHCPDIHPILSFSSKSHGHVAGRVGSTTLDFEIGEGRWITEFSTVRMLYNIGIQVNILASKVSCVGCVLSLPLYFSFCLCTTQNFIYLSP